MNNKIRETILGMIADIASDKNIEILWACESGSRAWGFASPNSDYDVRMVFRYPRDKYLSLFNQADDLSFIDGDWDFTAWDISKFLKLACKSNATPFEWLQSPIVYKQSEGFKESCWTAITDCFNARHTANHYLGLSHNSLNKGSMGDLFDIKKYFYVLRPLLAAKWCVDKQSIPPMEFAPLLSQVESNTALFNEIKNLQARKMKANEGDLTAVVPLIHDYIMAEKERLKETVKSLEVVEVDKTGVDHYFKSVISTL